MNVIVLISFCYSDSVFNCLWFHKELVLCCFMALAALLVLGATYSHVNDTATARKWSWSIRTKRYRFFDLLSVLGFATTQLILQHVSNLSCSSTPANYQVYYIKCPFT